MKTPTLIAILLVILSIGCQKEMAPAHIENNQSVYYGKLEKIKFITVQNDQSIGEIAQENSVPESEIKRLNSLTSYKSLHKGQILKLPIARFHLVKEDENIKDIAQIYDINLESLLEENNMQQGDKLSPGQYIRIPDTSRDYDAHTDNTHITFQESNISSEEDLKKVADSKTHEEEGDRDIKEKHFKNRTPLNNQDFIWPLQGKVLKKYGNYNGKLNDGINIAAPRGTNILAAGDGEVIFTGYKPEKFGNLVIVRHSNGYMSAYSHCDKVLVVKNEFVKKGTPIATCGSTGNVTQPQLQFTMKKGNHIIDPDS